MQFRFGPFVADKGAYRVRRDDEPVELTPKLLDLLVYLVEHPGALVTKEDLLDAVWPGANVTENAVAQAVSELRNALGDQAATPTYIRTIARRGYRFIAPIERVDEAAPPAPATAPLTTSAGGLTDRQTIVVADFDNVTGAADAAWLSAGIAETVTNDLSRLAHFAVVDRWRALSAMREHASPADGAQAVGADLVVTGSFQRLGSQIRITARVTDATTGEMVADAKIDGPFDAVFDLQDAIVATFARSLGVPAAVRAARVGVRETSSLDAYRAFGEGLLKIESLDTSLVSAAIDDFDRAIEHDSGYAAAYTGLANAKFVAYEMTRVAPEPNRAALVSGIDDARRAIELDEGLAEAHATLSFLLVSAAAFEEARTAAQRAVALEPENWRHQYRLGHALWGSGRLRAFERALASFPQFAFAALESAMVFVARGDIASAERIVRHRIEDPTTSSRFPGVGFHWLLGAIEAEGDRPEAALVEFAREGTPAALKRLYGPEYAAEAAAGAGFAHLALGAPDKALVAFRQGRALPPEHARCVIGEALASEALGRKSDAARHWQTAEALPAAFTRTGRPHLGRLVLAQVEAARGRTDEAVRVLASLLDHVPPCHLGWTVPLDPVLAGLRQAGSLSRILARLAERAR